ncbi:MAG: hypothetical protein AAGF95_20725 [Chloroflexota bacterium]
MAAILNVPVFVSLLTNWWSLFIVVPGILLLVGMIILMQRTNEWRNFVARIGLGVGVTTLTVGLLFLFGQSIAMWWPLLIIVPCLALMFSFATPVNVPFSINRIINFGLYCAFSGVLVGVLFLLNNLDILPLALFGSFQWWGVIVLFVGIVALRNALQAYRSHRTDAGVIILVGNGVYASTSGLLTILGHDQASFWAIPLAFSVMGMAIASIPAFASKQ